MKKVKVVSASKYDYVLEDMDKKRYEINIEFYDSGIDVGDYIYIDDNVLTEVNSYAYGPLRDDATVEDIIKIVKNDKEIYLQRYYG